jgi:hypothetical protein
MPFAWHPSVFAAALPDAFSFAAAHFRDSSVPPTGIAVRVASTKSSTIISIK